MDARFEQVPEGAPSPARLLRPDPSRMIKDGLREPGAKDVQQSLFPEDADSSVARIGEKTSRRLKQAAGFPEEVGIAA